MVNDDYEPTPTVNLTVDHEIRKEPDSGTGVAVTTAEAAKTVAKQWLTYAADKYNSAEDILNQLKSL